ncbi:MAG: radical SAM protein [Candidatus Hodarchaeota archaeon]
MSKKTELLIEITNKCPFNCIFCSSNSNIHKNKFIKKEKLFNIIRDAKSVGIEIIQLSGGEPFLHPNILEFISYILDEGLLLEIYTCGNIYKEGKYLPIPEKILAKYENNPGLTLRFNFQTIDKENFKKLTCNDFGMENLIISIKNSNKYKINTEVHIIPNCQNIRELDDIIKYLLKELNISHIKILRLILHGRAIKNYEKLVFDEDDLYYTLSTLKRKYINSQVEIGTAFSIYSNSCNNCQAAENKYMITCGLKLFPCTAFKNKTNCYIEINDKLSFKKIIKYKLLNRKLQAFRENLKCGYCLNRRNCDEICPIQKMVCNKIKQIEITKSILKTKAYIENITV